MVSLFYRLMNTLFKNKRRWRLVFLVMAILSGLAVFAVAYPVVSSGGDLAGY